MIKKHIKAADLFCGAGGSSSGLAQACSELGLGLRLLAINHWDIAIDTHSTNHPEADHLLTGLDAVDPRKAVPGGRLDLLVASPECQHHSIARGGKPINDQSRTSAWLVLRWCEALHIQNVLIENVKEFQGWGPIGTNGRPMKRRKGETFQAFINALKSLGYAVDYRVLNAADFGDPTSRERLFIIARRGRKPIVWPEPTHAPRAIIEKHAQPSLFKRAKLEPHRTAREIIDWSLEGESIFNRKRPLSPNTMARIFAGLRKYCGLPFLVPNFGEREGQPPRTHAVDVPLPAVTGHGAGALCEPFIVELRGGKFANSIDQPLSVVATKGAHHALCQPFLVTLRTHADADSLDDPLKTICASGLHHALCQPFVLGQQSGGAPRDVDHPLPTIATDGAIALIQPFLIPQHNDRTRSIDRPLQTLTTESRGVGLVEPFLVVVNHGQDAGYSRRTRSVDDPMPALTTSNSLGVAEPYLVKFNGTGKANSVDEPLDTISTKDRFGLCIPQIGAVLDIRFRMLQPHELAAAMGFPKTYVFKGNREQRVKQIGNAVPVRTAQALCVALLS